MPERGLVTEPNQSRLAVLSPLGPLGAHLARDPVLLGLTVVLSIAVLAPLFVTRFLPLTDLSYHAALASLAKQIWAGDPLVSHHFMFQPRPSPYWTTYILLIGSGSLVGPLYATHIVVGLAVLLVPLGMMRLMIAVGRSPRLGLWAFALAWDFSVSMGFIAYTLGVGLSFFFMARVLEGLRGGRWTTRREVLKTGALAVVLPLTHAQATATAGLLLGLLALAELPDKRHFRWLMGWAVLPVAALLPWVLTTPSGGRGPVPPVADMLYWAPAGERIARFVHYSLGFVQGPVASEIQGMTILTLLLLPLVFASMRGGSRRVNRRAWVLYAGAWLMYLTLPASLFWPFHQILIYERYTTFVMLFALLLPGVSFVGIRKSLLGPGLAMALASAGLVTWFFHKYDQHTAPLQEIFDEIPPGKKVLPIIWSRRTPESVHDTTCGITAYYNALKGGYSPNIFDTPNLPVRYVKEHQIPTPVWKLPRQINVGEHGVLYDYVIVQGIERDRLREDREYSTVAGDRVRAMLVKEAGDWRLYAVERIPVKAAD
jgi:hypothetical protein